MNTPRESPPEPHSYPQSELKKMPMLPVTESDFDSRIREKPVALVFFHAGWCGPCQIQKPVCEKLSEEFPDDLVFLTVDVDEIPALSDRFSVKTLPTLVLFSKGEPVEILLGFQQEEYLKSYFEMALSSLEEKDSSGGSPS